MKKYVLIALSIFVFGASVIIHAKQGLAEEKMVALDQVYSYEMMIEDLRALESKYPHTIQKKSIGKTKYGRDIWAVKVGNGNKTVLIDGTIHAREWVATVIIMKMIETYAQQYEQPLLTYEGKTVKEILDDTSIWFVPMLNPDGVELQQHGLASFPVKEHQRFIEMNQGREDFSSWKANADGIDLNRQFPIGWEGTNRSKNRNPTYQYYKGSKPFEALEVVHFVQFVKEIDPEVSISYHSSGQVLFWFYLYDSRQLRATTYELAEKIATETGYKIAPETDNTYTAVYRDWFSVNFERPSITIEVGKYAGEVAIPIDEIAIEWEKNKDVGLLVALEGSRLGEQRIQPMYGYLELDTPGFLYEAPNEASKSLRVLKTQQVIVKERRGDFFYIQTEHGDMWVKAEQYTYIEQDRFLIWLREWLQVVVQKLFHTR